MYTNFFKHGKKLKQNLIYFFSKMISTNVFKHEKKLKWENLKLVNHVLEKIIKKTKLNDIISQDYFLLSLNMSFLLCRNFRIIFAAYRRPGKIWIVGTATILCSHGRSLSRIFILQESTQYFTVRLWKQIQKKLKIFFWFFWNLKFFFFFIRFSNIFWIFQNWKFFFFSFWKTFWKSNRKCKKSVKCNESKIPVKGKTGNIPKYCRQVI